MARQSQTLNQQQQLGLRLSPHQVRFGRMLEMSGPEFDEEVARALEENPALERIDSTREIVDNKDDEGRDFTETADDLLRADYPSADDIPDYRTHISNRSADDRIYIPEAVDNDNGGIWSLDAQLADLNISPLQRELAMYVAGSLDSNGYLTRSTTDLADDISMAIGIDVAPRQLDDIIDIVRSLEPAGIGARDLRDCLLLQLRRLERNDAVDTATRIIDTRFLLYANHKYDRVCEQLKITKDQLAAATRVIRSLNPKPGTLLEGSADDDRMRHITPDFTVDIDSEGRPVIAIAGGTPELAVDRAFNIDNPAAEEFVRQRRNEAVEFIAIARRRIDTLMAVMRAIVQLQPRFFHTFDRADLRPMVLRDIAAITGFDLSVISRATATKYVMTPRGVVALKSLFSESASTSSDLSSASVETALQQIVDSENKAAPLSDDALCAELRLRGIDISRRTVTKYRERLNIPVARLRRH